MRAVLAFSLALLGTGCAGSASQRSLDRTVAQSIIKVFPEEGRRWSYEAENEVIIALDRLDAAKDRKHQAEVEIAAADQALEVANGRGGQGREVADARRDVADAVIDQAEAEIKTAEITVLCARAQLELTKAQLAVRFDLPVEEDFVKNFEAQYNDCAEELANARTEADRRANAAIEAKEKWRQTRAEFVRRTGDHNHGLWID